MSKLSSHRWEVDTQTEQYERCERCGEIVTSENYGRTVDKPGQWAGVICTTCDALDAAAAVDAALDAREVGESVADALARVGEAADRQMAEFAALAGELREIYGPDAAAMADGLLDGLLAYAAEWDAQPGTPATCPSFLLGDLVEITDPERAT